MFAVGLGSIAKDFRSWTTRLNLVRTHRIVGRTDSKKGLNAIQFQLIDLPNEFQQLFQFELNVFKLLRIQIDSRKPGSMFCGKTFLGTNHRVTVSIDPRRLAGRLAGQFEWLLFDGLTNRTTADALGANFN